MVDAFSDNKQMGGIDKRAKLHDRTSVLYCYFSDSIEPILGRRDC